MKLTPYRQRHSPADSARHDVVGGRGAECSAVQLLLDCGEPAAASVGVGSTQGGDEKDTAAHAIQRGQFVVHIPDEAIVEKMNKTAASLPPDVSEVELAGFTAVPSSVIAVPGLAEAKIRMECVLEQAIPLGGDAGAPACDLLIGRVVRFHIAEALYENGRIDARKLQPISRLAGSNYGKLGELFSLERPN